MSRVVHFEFSADDTERAVKFYQSVFGWKIQKWDGPMEYWMVTTGDEKQAGIDGGIMKRNAPEDRTYVIVDVTSVDETVKTIQDAGGSVAVPKMAIPGIGWMAYCVDTEGNVFGLMEGDSEAK